MSGIKRKKCKFR